MAYLALDEIVGGGINLLLQLNFSLLFINIFQQQGLPSHSYRL